MRVRLVKDSSYLLKGAILENAVEIDQDIFGDSWDAYQGFYSCKDIGICCIMSVARDYCEILEDERKTK